MPKLSNSTGQLKNHIIIGAGAILTLFIVVIILKSASNIDIAGIKRNSLGSNSTTTTIVTDSTSTNTINDSTTTNTINAATSPKSSSTTSKPEDVESVTDIDGNVYHSVNIGNQVWMTENLKTTHYRNGDPIPMVSDANTWGSLTAGAYCNYENNESNASAYGRLYNWYAINDDRNIAPLGWHVSTDEDWSALTIYLGGDKVAGGKIKEPGSTHWSYPNLVTEQNFNFKALPGGYRVTVNGIFHYFGQYGVYWSSNSNSVRYLDNSDTKIVWTSASNYEGFSVRCVKD